MQARGFEINASRATTNQAIKRKEMGGGNLSAGGYSNKRTDRKTNVFERGSTTLIGPARAPGPLPPSGFAGRQMSKQNYNNVPVRFDAMGGNYDQSINRAPIGGNVASDNGQLNATAIGSNLRPPKFGVGAPSLASWSRDPATDLPVAGGFPGLQDFAIRGQDPTNRSTVEWKGFPERKPTFFDSYNPSVERPVVNTRGSESTDLFIDQTASDGSNGQVRTTYNPFKAYPYDDAAAKVSTSDLDSFGANPISKHTVTVSAEAAAYMRTEMFGQLMFMALETAKRPRKNLGSNTFGLNRALPLYSIYPLSVVNYLLHCSQPFPQTIDDVCSIERVLASFQFSGIAISESGATSTRFTNGTDNPPRNRNVVLQFAGETKIANFFGAVPYGHHIGIKVMGRPVDEIYALNSEETPSYNIDAENPNSIRLCVAKDGERLSLNPIQFIPWYDAKTNETRPRLEELAYNDDFGNRCYGTFIPIGCITDEYTKRDKSIIERTPYSLAASNDSGALRININMERALRNAT
jgi:hypothetical protein